MGIGRAAVTALVMFALAFGKARTGAALGNPVLAHRGPADPDRWPAPQRSLLGPVLNAALG